MGIYIGATLHEVAHVVGASNALGEIVSTNAIIEKMIRVIFLVPFLILLSLWLIKTNFHTKQEKSKIVIRTIQVRNTKKKILIGRPYYLNVFYIGHGF